MAPVYPGAVFHKETTREEAGRMCSFAFRFLHAGAPDVIEDVELKRVSNARARSSATRRRIEESTAFREASDRKANPYLNCRAVLASP
jgi:hypothetical protein